MSQHSGGLALENAGLDCCHRAMNSDASNGHFVKLQLLDNKSDAIRVFKKSVYVQMGPKTSYRNARNNNTFLCKVILTIQKHFRSMFASQNQTYAKTTLWAFEFALCFVGYPIFQKANNAI
jgi:hypothetical protein